MQILVPCDGSESALRALRYAASVAQGNADVRLDLLYVLDPVKFRNPAAGLTNEDLEHRTADEFARVMLPAQAFLDAGGIPYRVHRRIGDPAGEIAAQVRESDCDSVVMGTRGMGQFASMMIGSVAIRTAHLVDVPVTLVK